MKLREEKTTIQKNVISILLNLENMLADFIAIIESFLGPEPQKTYYKTCCDKPNREWTELQ